MGIKIDRQIGKATTIVDVSRRMLQLKVKAKENYPSFFDEIYEEFFKAYPELAREDHYDTLRLFWNGQNHIALSTKGQENNYLIKIENLLDKLINK